MSINIHRVTLDRPRNTPYQSSALSSEVNTTCCWLNYNINVVTDFPANCQINYTLLSGFYPRKLNIIRAEMLHDYLWPIRMRIHRIILHYKLLLVWTFHNRAVARQLSYIFRNAREFNSTLFRKCSSSPVEEDLCVIIRFCYVIRQKWARFQHMSH